MGKLSIIKNAMKTITLTSTLFLLSIITLAAQGDKDRIIRNNIIHLQFGMERGYFKDLNFSPLNYSSGGLVVNSGYKRYFKNNDRLFFSVNTQLGELNTAVSEFNTSDHYNFNIELGYLKNIPVNSSELKLWLGGQYHFYFDAVFYEGTEAITYYGLHGLDLTGNISWDISSKHELSSTISLPVFGLLLRPPWTGWDKYIVEHEDNRLPLYFRGKWTSLNDFFAFNWNIQYHFAITPGWSLTAEYQFRYYRTDELKTAIIPSNQFTAGTRFSF
jgi:hypothetical protein